MTGTHRPVGIFALSEPVEAARTSLLDVAPTVYATLGVAGPEMDGKSLLGSVGTVEHAADATRESIYTPEQEAAVEERLRGLGYFE